MSNRLYTKRHRTVIGRLRQKRSKSFKTIKSAKDWAVKMKLKNYEITRKGPIKDPSAKNKKYKVIVKE